MEPLEWISILLAAAVFCAAAIFLFNRQKTQKDSGALDQLQSERDELAAQGARSDERAKQAEEALAQAREENNTLREQHTAQHGELAAANERIAALKQRLEEQKEELAQLHEKLSLEFENLAGKILQDNSKKFVAQNKESLDKLLLPLSEKISSFREGVEKSREQDIKDRASLKEQLRSLSELNQRMADEAQNLTTALKGQVKTQGNWGEMILETVLEKSGLVAGQEYETQPSLNGQDGKRYQPDVLIKLPENKHLVVDSKVSLVAYERCVNAGEEAAREVATKEHVTSLKAHVSELSKKRYEALYGINSPDFVLMFIPVEPAFTLAMQADDALFDLAFRQNVVIVTPSTLLATLRTVANIWRQEKQARNVLDIARRSGDLYDKFVGFYEDMQQIGQRIKQSQAAYDAAVNKLQEGKGNLVNRVQQLKKLGASAQKDLPQSAVDAASEDG